MLKKNINLSIMSTFLFLNIVICISLYISGNIWINEKVEENNNKILNTFSSKIESFKNLNELINMPDSTYKDFLKSNDLLYLMVLDNNGNVIFHNQKKLIGKTYKNDDISIDEIIKYKEVFQRKIKYTSDEFIEIGRPIDFEESQIIAIVGISSKNLLFYKFILWILITSLSVILILGGFLLSNWLYKKIRLTFENLEFLCEKVLITENITEKDCIVTNENKKTYNTLIKISQVLQNFKIELNKLKFDTLTGLCNSQSIKERLQYELLKAHRYKRPLSCIVIDVFNLDYISQHIGKDKLNINLKNLAEMYKNDLRKVDLIGKLSDTSFLILLPEIQETQSQIVAERLFKKHKDYKIIENNNELLLNFIIAINSYIHDTKVDENIFISEIEKTIHFAKIDSTNKIVYCNHDK